MSALPHMQSTMNYGKTTKRQRDYGGYETWISMSTFLTYIAGPKVGRQVGGTRL